MLQAVWSIWGLLQARKSAGVARWKAVSGVSLWMSLWPAGTPWSTALGSNLHTALSHLCPPNHFAGNWIASAGVKSGALSKQCFKAGLLDDTAVIAGAQCVAAGGVCTPDSVTKQPVGGWKLCCSGSCQVTKAGSGVGKCVSA